MELNDDGELANTERKLALLDQQIAKAKSRANTPANLESLQSLIRMANQLREEIVRYQSRQKRRAS
jgi:hypothetical protein